MAISDEIWNNSWFRTKRQCYAYKNKSPSMHPNTNNWLTGKMLKDVIDDLIVELLNLDE